MTLWHYRKKIVLKFHLNHSVPRKKMFNSFYKYYINNASTKINYMHFE